MKRYKHYDSMWAWLLDLIKGDPVARQYEKVEDAIRTQSQSVADAEADRILCDFYTERVNTIDPHTDWWGFADAKQKQVDHTASWTRNVQRVEEAKAKVEAAKVRMKEVSNG